jgi:5-methylcytosine-specific restriction endonuclease McrA
MPSNQGINTHRWRTQRQAIIKASTHCALCGQPLVPDAPPRSRWSTVIDHDLARKHGGTNHPTNLQPAHLVCNTRKENMSRRTQTRRSENW